MHDCVFCKIINKEISADIVYSDDNCVVFRDLHPKDKTHLLIVPRKHIPTLDDLSCEDSGVVENLVDVARKLALKHSIAGYRLQINVGKDGGQELFHLHVHFISKFPLI